MTVNITAHPEFVRQMKRYAKKYRSLANDYANFLNSFLCIDSTVYHIGASLKDLGKKWFAFNRMEMKTKELLGKVK